MTARANASCQSKSSLTGDRCGQSPIQVLVAGCIHEHVTTRHWCADCIAIALAGGILCGHCYAVDGHDCSLVIAGAAPAPSAVAS